MKPRDAIVNKNHTALGHREVQPTTMILGIGVEREIRCGYRTSLPHLLHALALSVVCTVPLCAQPAEARDACTQPADPANIATNKEETLIARLSVPGLNPDERLGIIRELESLREAHMDQYLARYRETIRENHKLHPEDPWLAVTKIGEALGAEAPIIERHNRLADFLDEHAPIPRQDTRPEFRAHLAKLPDVHRAYIEATQAALRESPASFQPIAAAQSRLQAENANDPSVYPEAHSRPLRETSQRQAHLRRLHQHLLESDPENTPPLAVFLHSQRISRFEKPSETSPTEP